MGDPPLCLPNPICLTKSLSWLLRVGCQRVDCLSIIILWLVLWFHWQDIYWSSRRSNLLSYRPTRGSEVDLASLIDCFWRASGVMTSCRLLSHTFCTVWTSYLGSSDAKTRGMDSNLSYRIGIEYRGTLTRTQSLWKDFPVFTSRLLHLQTVWLL